MFLSARSAFIRNLSVSAVNGAITLVILLIAPLGLAAVIINTGLVVVATFATATAADRIVLFLQADQSINELPLGRRSRSIRRSDPGSIDRH